MAYYANDSAATGHILRAEEQVDEVNGMPNVAAALPTTTPSLDERQSEEAFKSAMKVDFFPACRTGFSFAALLAPAAEPAAAAAAAAPAEPLPSRHCRQLEYLLAWPDGSSPGASPRSDYSAPPLRTPPLPSRSSSR